ncbi:membrane protein insertase YidC [Flaviflexus massiliensis]|uniref:membrane protein insertase YidC n=1 Tax=Flaviflexus massiliensis TaxID=1522309 RepID=UPI0006D59724|nr:membrane protein insertase YidC [Flaviflexus massiliensis]
MDTILFPIMWVIAWIMNLVHMGLTAIGLPDGAGSAWVWSIVGLTIVVRLLILPLFKKQINSSRAQQMIQPELQKLQKKYKNKKDTYSQQRMQAEMQAIYKDAGTSPFAACMPLLIQTPIFLALFRVLNNLVPIANGTRGAIGPLDQALAKDIEASQVFGAPLAASFNNATAGGGDEMTVRIVAMILVILMSATMFFSQRMMISKNMPEASKSSDNPMYRTQKMMIYIFPVIFLVSGVAFPIGVLVYWVVSNIWSFGQQLYMITQAPAPGSEAYKAKQKRDRERRTKQGLPAEETTTSSAVIDEPKGQRQQPVGKNRAKRKGLDKEQATALPDPEPTPDPEPIEEKPSPRSKKKSKKQRQQETAATPSTDEETKVEQSENSSTPAVDKGGMTPAERAAARAERRAEQRRQQRKKREGNQ